jgi:hypothetical protein
MLDTIETKCDRLLEHFGYAAAIDYAKTRREMFTASGHTKTADEMGEIVDHLNSMRCDSCNYSMEECHGVIAGDRLAWICGDCNSEMEEGN